MVKYEGGSIRGEQQENPGLSRLRQIEKAADELLAAKSPRRNAIGRLLKKIGTDAVMEAASVDVRHYRTAADLWGPVMDRPTRWAAYDVAWEEKGPLLARIGYERQERS